MIKELTIKVNTFFLLKNTKKHALNTLLTNTTIVSIVIKASSFLKVSNSIRNSISTVSCLDYNMPYSREETSSSFPSNVHETLTVLKAIILLFEFSSTQKGK